MRRLTLRFMVASLTFIIGVTAAVVWFAYRMPSVETLEYSPADVAEILNVPFCDLARDPNSYDKQIVRTEAIYFANSENEALYNPTCGFDHADAWVKFDASYKVNPEIDERLMEIFRPSRTSPAGEASVTVVGRFHAPDGKGYGHLNGYRFLFEIMRIERVEKVSATEH
jgi:hypothetical protein